MEELGIIKLPEVSKRIKQNFKDLNINEHGDILVDEDDKDEDFVLPEIPYVPMSKRLGEKRNFIETSRKRKAVEDVSTGSKKPKNIQSSSLNCEHCEKVFTRKDNLVRHVRNKHKK